MILSIHVPKAAGNSFREALVNSFGDRFMKDYGDWAGFDEPQANARRALREQAARARRDELAKDYDVIHGHFVADKYRGLFAQEQFIAFFRDPFQQAQAHYYFLLRNPQREHPEEKIFHDAKMSLLEYLEWDAFRNHQTQFLGSLPIESLAFVGLAEEYAKSLEIFKTMFGRDLGPPRFLNVNGNRGAEYPVDPAVRAALEKYRAADIELYAKAKELFRRQPCGVAA
ncbi:MAG: hypothetical protein ACYDDQ_00060 [Vulcanimicrobiaceae bacterium]